MTAHRVVPWLPALIVAAVLAVVLLVNVNWLWFWIGAAKYETSQVWNRLADIPSGVDVWPLLAVVAVLVGLGFAAYKVRQAYLKEKRRKHKAYLKKQQQQQGINAYLKKWSRPRIKSKEAASIAQTVHQMVNLERETHGVPVLGYDHHLEYIARGHSRDMAHYNYMRHVNGKGEAPTARSARKGYLQPTGGLGFKGLGENIAQTWATWTNSHGKPQPRSNHELAVQVVRLWMNSEGHRRNILNPYYQVQGIGFARARKGGKVYFTQNFYG